MITPYIPDEGMAWSEDKRLTWVVPEVAIFLTSRYAKETAAPRLVTLAGSADLNNFMR